MLLPIEVGAMGRWAARRDRQQRQPVRATLGYKIVVMVANQCPVTLLLAHPALSTRPICLLMLMTFIYLIKEHDNKRD